MRLRFLFVSAMLVSAAFGQTADQACIDCHSDASLTRTLDNGAVQSLAITHDSLITSRHAKLSCVDCHTDLKGFEDFPHAEKLQPVACASCHAAAAQAVARGGHEGALKCAACHGTHNILSPSDAKSGLSKNRVDRTCAECHNRMHAPHAGRTARYERYDVGIHGQQAKSVNGDLPHCTSCHFSHDVTSEHKLADKLEQNCVGCHGDIAEKFKHSVHGAFREGRNRSYCYDCHGEHRSRAPSDTTLRVTNETPAEATCGSCHAESVARYNQSLHAYALESGSPRAPRCESCHGAHDIRPVSDAQSPMHRSNQVQTCAKCHSQIGITLDPDVRLPMSFENYLESTHGKLLKEGNTEVPVCIDCHGGHAIRGGNDPLSTIAHVNIDKTCGQCHSAEQKAYQESIHYRALMSGIDDSPTCTGCHGEHLLISPKDPRSKVSHNRVAAETCGKCHENPVVIRKYGLAPDVVKTYADSYHGLANRRQSDKTPSCADCHEAHAVRTARDSLSTIHTTKVAETCAKCHPQSDAKFAASYTHQALQPKEGGAQWWIARIYWVLLAVVIGGMVIHNLIILNFHMLEARKQQEHGPKVVRFDRHQIYQHMALSISFITLAVTGFALKYPDAWWVRLFSAVGLNEPVRRILHRVMAVLLIACSIYHIVYLFMTRRGREEWKALLPSVDDAGDLAQTMKYYTGKSKRSPEYDRYDYSQKAEYWALIWGTVLMIATGFVLWFPAELSPVLPAWAIPVSQTIHLYEAWLATMAIVVWHFFFVIFHPEEYPMSWTWLTGKMSLHHVKNRHGRWFRQMSKEPDGDNTPPISTAELSENGAELKS